MHFLQAINSDISVLIVCNKTGGTINGDKKTCTNLLFANYCNDMFRPQFMTCNELIRRTESLIASGQLRTGFWWGELLKRDHR